MFTQPLIRSKIINKLAHALKLPYGINNMMCVDPKQTITLPYDVYSVSNEVGRKALIADLNNNRVDLVYCIDGIDYPVRGTTANAKPIPAPAPVPQPQLTPTPAPAPVKMEKIAERVGAPAVTMERPENAYSEMFKKGSIKDTKSEAVAIASPDGKLPEGREASKLVSVDDWGDRKPTEFTGGSASIEQKSVADIKKEQEVVKVAEPEPAPAVVAAPAAPVAPVAAPAEKVAEEAKPEAPAPEAAKAAKQSVKAKSNKSKGLDLGLG